MAQFLQHLSDLAQFAGRWGGAGCSSGPGCSFSIALCSRLGGLLLEWGGSWFLLSNRCLMGSRWM